MMNGALIETKCNLCGCDSYKVLHRASSSDLPKDYKITDHKISLPLSIVKCRNCGLIYVNIHQAEEDLLSEYINMADDRYLDEEIGRRRSMISIIKMLNKISRTGRILDIGCAAGFLLDEAKKECWEVHGVELSKWAVNYAREELGIENIFEGTLKKANFPANYFDVVVLRDTIEHLADPKATLNEIRRILKPSGILCINTPNISSLASKILGAKWWGLKQAHLFYFTPQTLSKMLELTGFKPVKIRSCARTFTLGYWAEKVSAYNKVLYKILSLFKNNKFLNKGLICINFGDQIEVFARKSYKLEYLEELEISKPTIPKIDAKVIAVLPAYNAAKTLQRTIDDIPKDSINDIILVDDLSKDRTVEVAKKLGLKVFVHKDNKGYGGNQKTCYTKALEQGADIVVMVHPDYQYDPKAIPKLVEPIKQGRVDAVFGSRILKGGALESHMPRWKYNSNILLTTLANMILDVYLTEYHSGFRAYSSKYLKSVNFLKNSDNFIFDTEIIVQGVIKHMRFEEVPIRTRYFDEASSIKFLPCVFYGLGILKTLLKYTLHTKGIIRFKQFD